MLPSENHCLGNNGSINLSKGSCAELVIKSAFYFRGIKYRKML